MTNPKHTCPECLRSFTYPAARAGEAVACPACKKPIRLPRISQAAEKAPITISDTSSGDTQTQVAETKPCPFCAETILVAASKCKHCGEYLKKEEVPSSSIGTATSFAIVAAIIGGLIAIGSLMMDTTVSTMSGDRVYNIGLQQQQMMSMLLGLVVFAMGVIVAILTWKKGYGNSPSNTIVESNKEKVLYLAKNQKYLIWTLLAQILGAVLLLIVPPVGILFLLATGIAQVLSVFKIAITSFPGFLGVFLSLLSLIPIFGLFVIVCINVRATSLLEESGVKVAFFGVPKDELVRLEIEKA
jgi:hypothetical protein